MFDVHIGFMDEEVKPVLNQLRKLNVTPGPDAPAVSFESVMHRLFLVNRDRPIYVIERDNILNDTSLFQMIEHQYSLPWDYKAVAELPERPGQPAKVVKPKGDDPQTPGAKFTIQLAEMLAKAANDSDFAFHVTSLWNSGNKTKLAHKGQLAYTVYAFNSKRADVDHRNPVVIVRAPEMGLQPELIRLNLKLIMLALGQIQLPGNASPRSSANVYMYGAGGAMGDGTKPGKLQHIMGSVYIGAEVDGESLVGKAELARGDGARKGRTESLAQKWVGLVAFACPDSHIILFKSAPQDGYRAALDLAKAEFKSKRLMAPLEQCQKLVKRLYPSYSISLTASDFIGGDLKAAAREQGLGGDCNMEDYHVLRILHEMRFGVGMPRLFNHGLARIDCDPPHIPASLFTAFKAWAREARWTREHYVEGILWGLRGVTYDSVSWAHAHWGYKDRVATLNVGSLDKYFYLVGERVLCPFFTELACDLLETAATAPSSAAVFGAANANVPHFDTLQYRAKMVRAMSVSLVGKPDQLANLKLVIGKFVETFGEILEAGGLKAQGVDVWPIWARPGWGGERWRQPGAWAVVNVTSAALAPDIAAVWDEHFPVTNAPNGNLDRALYKSTNMMALQVLAPSGGAKIVRDHAWSNVMDELKNRHEKEWKPRLAAKDWKAVDQQVEDRRHRADEQFRQEQLAALAGVLALVQRLRASNSCKPPSPFTDDGPPPPPPTGPMVMAF